MTNQSSPLAATNALGKDYQTMGKASCKINASAAFFLVTLFFCVHNANAEQFIRKTFQYEKMERKAAQDCGKSQSELLDLALRQVDNLQSKEAVISANKAYSSANKCLRAHSVYAWCLFRSGEWLKAIEVIDTAIERFGSYPELVVMRADLGREMGDLGTIHKVVDGNSIYFPKEKGLPFEEEQFREENYRAALNDFLYIIKDHPEKYDETFSVAYLYYMLGNHEESNRVLERLLNIKEYRVHALMGMTKNYLAMKQFVAAEKILSEMEAKDPKAVFIQKQFVSLYTAMGDNSKNRDHQKKLQFYSSVPPFTDLKFNEENFGLVSFFAGEDNKGEEKEKKLDAILKGENKELAIDICLTVLAMHPHGTGLEEMAANALIRFGKDSVPKTIQLLHSPGISTCTITIAADILATVKDERGWQPLVDCLPWMTRLPSTLLPPLIPDKIVKFDRERGMKILLPFLRDMIRVDQNGDASKDPAESFEKSMVYSAFYSPLESIDRNELIKLARNYGYSEKETRILLKNASAK